VHCQGKFDVQSMLEVYGSSFAAAANAGRRAILVDVTALTGAPPTIPERFKMGTYVAELQRGKGRGILIAGVGRQPMVHAGKFGEMVARNRAANARIFTDKAEAIAWIRAEKEKLAATAH